MLGHKCEGNIKMNLIEIGKDDFKWLRKAFMITNKCNHIQYVHQLYKAMYGQKITDRPITSPGGGTVTLVAGEAVVEESRRHASRRENSTLAISVATHSGRSGMAHVIMNRNDSIMCCKKHQTNINIETEAHKTQNVFRPILLSQDGQVMLRPLIL